MSRLACTFCAHANPDGSKFCNQCGSPLHLVPCTQCEAINNASDTHCYACGAPLTEEATAELATAGFVERSHGETGAWVYDGPPAVRLADHLENIPWDLPTRARAVPPHQHASAADVPEAPEALPPEEQISTSPYASGRAYKRHSSRWGKRIVLGCALLAIVAAIAWSSLRIALPWHAQPVTTPVPTPPSVPQTPLAPRQEQAPPPTPENPPASAPGAAPAPTATEEAAPESNPVSTPPSAEKARPANARRPSEAVTRTREQALRDAETTRRLIERDLATVPRR